MPPNADALELFSVGGGKCIAMCRPGNGYGPITNQDLRNWLELSRATTPKGYKRRVRRSFVVIVCLPPASETSVDPRPNMDMELVSFGYIFLNV